MGHAVVEEAPLQALARVEGWQYGFRGVTHGMLGSPQGFALTIISCIFLRLVMRWGAHYPTKGFWKSRVVGGAAVFCSCKV